MTREQEDLLREALSVAKENRALLTEVRGYAKEVADYVREVQSREYREADDMKQFCINVTANGLWELMEDTDRNNIKDAFKKR